MGRIVGVIIKRLAYLGPLQPFVIANSNWYIMSIDIPNYDANFPYFAMDRLQLQLATRH